MFSSQFITHYCIIYGLLSASHHAQNNSSCTFNFKFFQHLLCKNTIINWGSMYTYLVLLIDDFHRLKQLHHKTIRCNIKWLVNNLWLLFMLVKKILYPFNNFSQYQLECSNNIPTHTQKNTLGTQGSFFHSPQLKMRTALPAAEQYTRTYLVGL